ncbi:MAG: SGNH/GDSL hydrolase family protein [Bacteroidota bacterium]|nr:SGNH/GDSL hydrolase family protein [Bacteroidota bacterium]
MKYLLVLAGLFLQHTGGRPLGPVFKGRLVPADDKHIQYMGRIDFTDPKRPRFWSPGVIVRARFKGASCGLLLRDEVIWGKDHNYVEIVVDDREPYRVQMETNRDTIRVQAAGGPEDDHLVTLCKDTESGIGYLEFDGLLCEGLLPASPLPSRKIEFIGNSITCGSGIDVSETPCGKGKWYDQHNAWFSYGPLTARALDAQWHISAVSGIGLMYSCCNMGEIIMPRVFDKVNQRSDSIAWDFSRYTPDVVTVCLGQNDGIQDSTEFCNNYVLFLETLRSHYPYAKIVCLGSPMGDAGLNAALRGRLTAVAARMNRTGDMQVYTYFYSRRYFHGCGMHPDMEEHRQIAAELTAYLKKLTGW